MAKAGLTATANRRRVSRPEGTHRLGVDIGGTFTDVVLLGDDGSLRTCKVLSTPDDYARGVVEGAIQLLREAGVEGHRVRGIVHATTVASNTVLEGRGARTALITTEGFRDVLEMRRLRIPVMYDLQYVKPPPLVPRRHRYEVRGRIGPKGEIRRELDEAGLLDVADTISRADIDALAISLLHSYANAEHEQRVAELVRAVVGTNVYITCSAEILPEIREYERTSTAVVNAYVGPAVSRYLGSLIDQLAAHGLDAPLEIMQSAGGTMTPRAALKCPAFMVESGPAAGVIACANLARETGRHNVISFDMGGTTAKAAMLEDGEPVRTAEYEIGGGINLSSRLVKGGGYAIKLPFIDVSEIGAGGGSIVRIDEFERASVGPHSAGAAPGPVCYGLGGVEPTLADALAVLGYLNPEQLAGGAVTPDVAAAHDAIEETVGAPLGLSTEEAAHGVLMVAVSTMTRAVKAVSTYRGRDPRDFALCAFGGNGPMVGVEIARALEMKEVIVPSAPGVFSALGLLFATSEQEFVRTLLWSDGEIDGDRVAAAFEDLIDEASAALSEEGIEDVDHDLRADLRYAGQAYELTVRVRPGDFDGSRLRSDFVSEHRKTYGHGSDEDPIDLVSIRVLARRRAVDRTEVTMESDRTSESGRTTRQAYFGPDLGRLETPVIRRAGLGRDPVAGPLFVDEYDSTTVVPPGCSARLDRFGSIEISVG
jgi:N-methylhydantoinase A